MDPVLREMLKQAVEAAKDGDITASLKLIQEVIKAEPENVQAWLLLARVVPDEERKRKALERVLTIEPENEKALALLDKMDAPIVITKPADEVMPGINRRSIILAGIALLAVLIIAGMIIALVGAESARREDQRLALLATEAFRPTQIVLDAMTATQEAVNLTLVFFETVSPTPTPTNTSDLPTLPATFTPTPTVTLTPTPIPPPDTLIGSLIGKSGRGAIEDDMPLVRFLTESREPQPLPDNLSGRAAQWFPSQDRLVFNDRQSGTFTDVVTVYDFASGERTVLNLQLEDAAFSNERMITLSADGGSLAFIATPFDQTDSAVYVYNFETATTRRLTTDNATYTYPAFAPDGERIIVVRQTRGGESPGTDLVLLSADGQSPPQALTTDRDAIIETHPRWSPAGDLIFFAGRADGARTHDIYVLNPANPGTPLLRVESPADDILPIPDPSGRYLAFASNRTGTYNIFIFDLTGGAIYQATTTANRDNYPSDWR